MATIGHSLAGLTFAAAAPPRSTGQWSSGLWIGFVVVGAHLLDLVEWAACRVLGLSDDIRFLTESVAKTTLLAAAVCVIVRLTTQIRGLAFYSVLAASVFSHYVLDQYAVRWFVADAYRVGYPDGLPDRSLSIEAEVWLYGLPMVLVVLLRAACVSGVSRAGRLLSALLAMGALAAFATRSRWAWPPVYGLCLAHALVLGRRRLTRQMLWNIAPLLVMAPLLAIELWSGYLYHEARRQLLAGEYDAAIETYRRAIALPARRPTTQYLIKLGQVCRSANRLSEAEEAYERAHAQEPHWWAPAYHLAMFRSDPALRNSPCYRPDEAERLYRQILSKDSKSAAQPAVKAILAGLKNRIDSRAHDREASRRGAGPTAWRDDEPAARP